MKHLMGIDLGTSSVKVLLMEEGGSVSGVASEEYPILIPREGHAEQEPEAWWRATAGAIRRLLGQSGVRPSTISGVSFSGQMHGLVPLDREGSVVRPAIIWCDQRSTGEVEEIYRVIGRKEMGRITLNPVFTGFMIASLLWMKRNEPESYRRIATVMLPKDYLRYRLTGTRGTDVTDASSTLAFDTTRRQWAGGLLEALGVPFSIFPPCALPTDQAGVVGASAAADTGLASGTPVMAGGSDQPMQAIGSGLTAPGALSITTGTGGQLFTLCERPLLNPLLNTHTFCHVIPGSWYVMAATLSAGMSLSWFARAVAREEDLAALTAEAAAVPPGSEGAIFLPYLAGERTPHLDPEASGLFYGLTLKHTRAHMTRAVLEGVAYSYRECLETLLSFGVPVDRIVGAGGGARSPLWLQIQADVLGRPIAATTAPEQASLGAAITAGIGVGLYADYSQACKALIRGDSRLVEPDPSLAEVYQACYETYRGLYARLRGADRARRPGSPPGATPGHIEYPGK